MNLEEARELMHKLNHGDAKSGVGSAKTLKAYDTKDIENPDGEVIGSERVNERDLPLGYVGPAMPCCLGDGDEHEAYCMMFGRDDDAHPWDDDEQDA